ncbi:acyltransferase [Novosphingobium sp. G106]|uniref:acyltransferase family protein n=1 Tax=Novosphingobium sp. G106 TaxID=2849500 RepID=UPI001C2CD3F6|nr:acyltransferase [Novosphingobium sp. G106]MBV1687216.1 acyltransferase [Novosphingobium sp. G106]
MAAHSQQGRLGELDALRGIAAMLVLLFHYTAHSEAVLPAARHIAHGLSWGHYGVQLFFAISGFVILMTLERTASSADFLVSRFARLLPAYWAAVLFTSASVVLLGAEVLAQPGPIILTDLSMLQGFLYLPSVDGVYWSLTVELAFYFCMWSLWRARLLGRIEAILLGWIGLTVLWWLVPALPSRVGMVLIVRYIPFFAIGMAAYRVRTGARRWSEQLPLLASGLAAVALVESPESAAVYASVVAIFALLVGGKLGWLANPPLLWLGALSYTIYLIHQNFGYALIAALERAGFAPWAALLCAIAATLTVSQLIHNLVEQPALHGIRTRWKQRGERDPLPAAE